MIWKIVFDAIALMLVLEGLWPFLSPKRYKQFLLVLFTQSEKRLHMMGLILMLIGLVIVSIVHSIG